MVSTEELWAIFGARKTPQSAQHTSSMGGGMRTTVTLPYHTHLENNCPFFFSPKQERRTTIRVLYERPRQHLSINVSLDIRMISVSQRGHNYEDRCYGARRWKHFY